MRVRALGTRDTHGAGGAGPIAPWRSSFLVFHCELEPLEVRAVLLCRVYGISRERAARVYVIG